MINILFGRNFIKDKAHWVSTLAVAGSWVVAVMTLIDVLGGKIVNEDLYDHAFVEKWTNAPHLIRKDTNRLLRESDVDPQGSKAKVTAEQAAAVQGAPRAHDS